MAMVANPMAAEAARATHSPRRNPRQGVRASCSNLALRAGSMGLESSGTSNLKAQAKW